MHSAASHAAAGEGPPRGGSAPSSATTTRPNEQVAEAFEKIAELLGHHHHQAHRSRAYLQAADALRQFPVQARVLYEHGGEAALRALPHIGDKLASLIAELLQTGRITLLERLEAEEHPEEVFASLPGIGDGLAARIVDELHIDTLEDLEAAASDGRLRGLHGIGAKRVGGLQSHLAAILGRRQRRQRGEERAGASVGNDSEASAAPRRAPPAALLLEIDRRYRELAAAGRLHRIAPRRFNREHKAWLPIMQIDSDGWHFNALYSNTARAHQLGHIHDWVVLHYRSEQEPGRQGQCTVVTEHRGPEQGRRVIRGRELECHRQYREYDRRHPVHFDVPKW